MQTESLQSAVVRKSIDAINQGDLEAFMQLFTPDATLEDGTHYNGVHAIRAWAQRETFGPHLQFLLEREVNTAGTVVEGQVRSQGGYNGPARFAYTLQGDLIVRLVIS